MKKNGPCPKCKSAKRLRVPGGRGVRSGIPVTRLAIHNIGPTRYVCTQCGFVEEFVELGPDLEKIKQRYRNDD